MHFVHKLLSPSLLVYKILIPSFFSLFLRILEIITFCFICFNFFFYFCFSILTINLFPFIIITFFVLEGLFLFLMYFLTYIHQMNLNFIYNLVFGLKFHLSIKYIVGILIFFFWCLYFILTDHPNDVNYLIVY